MDLYEYEGKALFREYGITTPQGKICTKIRQIAPNTILKAQVLYGKRGKKGLIKKAKTKKEVGIISKKIFKHCKKILAEEIIEGEKEYYLSMTINAAEACYTLMFSEAGGMDIEEVKKNKIKKLNFVKFSKKEVHRTIKNKQITIVAQKLFKLLQEKDAIVVEINPLVKSEDLYYALDAKVTIDDNSLFRQKQFQQFYGREHTALEAAAAKRGLHYVELDGNIAVIGNGAGLVMATLDTLKYSNFKAANFCDAPGGTSKKAMMESLKIVTRKKGIIALFINIFGGMTKTDDVAKAIVAFKRKCTPTMPIIIRIYGTNYEEAHEILKKNNMKAFKTIASAMNELKKQCQL